VRPGLRSWCWCICRWCRGRLCPEWCLLRWSPPGSTAIAGGCLWPCPVCVFMLPVVGGMVIKLVLLDAGAAAGAEPRWLLRLAIKRMCRSCCCSCCPSPRTTRLAAPTAATSSIAEILNDSWPHMSVCLQYIMYQHCRPGAYVCHDHVVLPRAAFKAKVFSRCCQQAHILYAICSAGHEINYLVSGIASSRRRSSCRSYSVHNVAWSDVLAHVSPEATSHPQTSSVVLLYDK
jgi:hypothetical protein